MIKSYHNTNEARFMCWWRPQSDVSEDLHHDGFASDDFASDDFASDDFASDDFAFDDFASDDTSDDTDDDGFNSTDDGIGGVFSSRCGSCDALWLKPGWYWLRRRKYQYQTKTATDGQLHKSCYMELRRSVLRAARVVQGAEL